MDDNKDIQKTDALSRFLDTQPVRTNPFGDNRAGERAYRRAERIVAALYLLTNHLPVHEPIRGIIRTESTQLLTCVLALRDELRAVGSQGIRNTEAKIRSLISMVRIVTVAGYVSSPNAHTMIEALDELGNFISAAQRSVLSESIALSRDDLLDVRSAPLARTRAPHRDVKDMHAITDSATISDRRSPSLKVPVAMGQLSLRAQSVIQILKENGSLGIRDICSNLPEYSEKMIQRELLELVSQGKVAKAGLKRWSRYSAV